MPSLLTLLHHIPLISTYWITHTIYPVLTQRFFTDFILSFLYIDLTFFQIIFTTLLSHLYLHFTRSSPPKPINTSTNTSLSLSIPFLHFLGVLLTNLSFYKLGAVETLLWKFVQPVSAAFLNWLYLQQPSTHVSLSGVVLAVLGVCHYSASDFKLSAYIPVILATILVSARDVCIKLSIPSRGGPHEGDKHLAETTGSMTMFSGLLLRTVPIAFLLFLFKVLRYGFHTPTIISLVRNAAILAFYHVASVALIPRIDAFSHSALATLKRLAGILFAILVFRVPLNHAHFEGLGLAFSGFVVYLIGRRRGNFGASAVLLVVVSGALMLGAFLVGGGIVFSDVPQISSDVAKSNPESVNGPPKVERVSENTGDPGQYLVIISRDYQGARKSLTYAGYEEAINHDGGNVGNLVWKYAAHERLTDFGGASMCETDDVLECVEKARNKGMSPLVFSPVANLLNPDKGQAFKASSDSIKREGLRVLIIGMGVQIPFRLRSTDPEFNSSARITTSSDDYLHPQNTKDYLRTMSESGGEMLLRGDFSLNVTRAGGFTRGHSLGCPSLFINDDVHLGKTLQEKYQAISARQGDKSLKIAVNLKSKCDGIEKQVIHFRDNYPNSRFYAQGPGDMRLLSQLKVPYERTRLFQDVEDWIEDLKEMDIGYGLRIHGNMIAIGAGLPVLVAASDWRVLELVQRMKIPYVISYDPAFEEDVDIAKIVGEMGTFEGDAFDRNRCEIAKVYIRVFQRYGLDVRKHVKEISQLC